MLMFGMRTMIRRVAMIMTMALLFTGAGAADAETRIALIIANAKYQNVSALPNPTSDAQLIKNTFSALGFSTVTLVNNASRDQMQAALRSFSLLADKADVAVIYYAGHGMEVNNTNYLIPVDAHLARDRDAEVEAVKLDTVQQMVEGAHRLRIVILDACRNNPFDAKMLRSGGGTRAVSQGLAAVEPTGESLVVFAAKAGRLAADGNAQNSPFARALARRMVEPGTEINLMFRKVRDDVMQETSGEQEPFTYGSLSSREYYFKPAVMTAGGIAPSTAPAQVIPAISQRSNMGMARGQAPATMAPPPAPAPVAMRAVGVSLPTVSVGPITTSVDCKYFMGTVGHSVAVTDGYIGAAASSWRSIMFKACMSHFEGIRTTLQSALASSGKVIVGPGGLTLSGRISNVADSGTSSGGMGGRQSSVGMLVSMEVTLRDKAGRIVYGVPLTKRIETGYAMQGGGVGAASLTSGAGTYDMLQQEVALAVARKVAQHVSPMQVMANQGRKISLSYGSPFLSIGMLVNVVSPDGMNSVRYRVSSATEGRAIADLYSDGDTRSIVPGSIATIIEDDDPAANQSRFEKVELP